MGEEKEQTLIEHLEELRKTLLDCILAIAIVLPFVFYFSSKILNFLIKIITKGQNITLNYFAPMEVFIIQLKIALLVDIVICFPYIAKKLWDFILPALYDNERKIIKKTVLFSSLLFILGVGFCIFIILPLIINFGLSFSNTNLNPMFGITQVINLALSLAFVFGLMFQIPLVTRFLIKSGIIEYNTISNIRPYVVVILLIFSALLTPPDIISQILLFIPTYLLFELGLLTSKERNRND